MCRTVSVRVKGKAQLAALSFRIPSYVTKMEMMNSLQR